MGPYRVVGAGVFEENRGGRQASAGPEFADAAGRLGNTERLRIHLATYRSEQLPHSFNRIFVALRRLTAGQASNTGGLRFI